jgi:hypothetical protein
MRARLTLPDSPSDVRLTNLDRPLRPPAFTAELDGFKNKNLTSTIPVQLIAGQSVRILPRNLRRSGLQIQNVDASAVIRYSLGNDLGSAGLQLNANGGAVLYDFTCPPDEVYLFSLANANVIVLEMTRGFDPPKLARK